MHRPMEWKREIARSALSLARSAQAERDNESCFFVCAAGVHRLIRRFHVKHTDAQLDMVAWKLDESDKEMVVSGDNQDLCVMNLLKSVTEVRNDYQNLRKELMEVQALQRELSDKLRRQLRHVHGKFAQLRERLAAANAQ
ncbi:hypothetical protein EVAR_64200_1 [Eumeta japonica]|uniref:Ska2 N-terminal domain-containing protein n=1 Tax=Eumeta variegata TaxID=151549 RepID=A0A4C1YYC8_EUMVA|nr:hypothetical protein EVAR_64200_1 [Eumeta japonica]